MTTVTTVYPVLILFIVTFITFDENIIYYEFKIN